MSFRIESMYDSCSDLSIKIDLDHTSGEDELHLFCHEKKQPDDTFKCCTDKIYGRLKKSQGLNTTTGSLNLGKIIYKSSLFVL